MRTIRSDLRLRGWLMRSMMSVTPGRLPHGLMAVLAAVGVGPVFLISGSPARADTIVGTGLSSPEGVAVDGSGDVFIASQTLWARIYTGVTKRLGQLAGHLIHHRQRQQQLGVHDPDPPAHDHQPADHARQPPTHPGLDATPPTTRTQPAPTLPRPTPLNPAHHARPLTARRLPLRARRRLDRQSLRGDPVADEGGGALDTRSLPGCQSRSITGCAANTWATVPRLKAVVLSETMRCFLPGWDDPCARVDLGTQTPGNSETHRPPDQSTDCRVHERGRFC